MLIKNLFTKWHRYYSDGRGKFCNRAWVVLHDETVYMAVRTNYKVCGTVVPSKGKFSYYY